MITKSVRQEAGRHTDLPSTDHARMLTYGGQPPPAVAAIIGP